MDIGKDSSLYLQCGPMRSTMSQRLLAELLRAWPKFPAEVPASTNSLEQRLVVSFFLSGYLELMSDMIECSRLCCRQVELVDMALAGIRLRLEPALPISKRPAIDASLPLGGYAEDTFAKL